MRIFIYINLEFVDVKYFSSFLFSTYRMSLFEFSGVTVLVGMYSADQSDVQMTRRISKMFLHRQYNAATYVSRYTTKAEGFINNRQHLVHAPFSFLYLGQ